jgi:hypothetical protein
MKTLIALLILPLAAWGAEPTAVEKVKATVLKTLSSGGKTYANAKVVKWSGSDVKIVHDDGVSMIRLSDLPQSLQSEIHAALASDPGSDMAVEIANNKARAEIARMEREASAKGIVNGPTDDMRLESDRGADESGWYGPIPGANPVNTYLGLEEKGFTLKRNMGNTLAQWTCTQTDGAMDLHCTLLSKPGDIQRVYAITATIQDGNAVPNLIEAAGFLGWVASLPYDGAQQEAAKQWVSDQVLSGVNGSKIISGVKFDLYLQPRSRMLRVAAAP